MSEENTVEAAEESVDAANNVGLNVGDLAGLRQIIAVAAQRGAFRAEEMEVIGRVYNKLNAFLNSIAPQEGEAEELLIESVQGESCEVTS